MSTDNKSDRRFQIEDEEVITLIDWYCESHGIKKKDFTEMVFRNFFYEYLKNLSGGRK